MKKHTFLKKAVSALLICIIAFSMLPAQASASVKTVNAHNYDELVAALADNTTIVLDGKDYDTGWSVLSISGYTGLTIQGKKGTRLLSNSGMDEVVMVTSCTDFVISNVVMGHDVPQEWGCTAGVLSVSYSTGQIIGCDIFGCGVSGINCYNSELQVKNSVIRDCSESIGLISYYNSYDEDTGYSVIFENCTFSGNAYGTPAEQAFYCEEADASRVAFINCAFNNNRNSHFFACYSYSEETSNWQLKDLRPVLINCVFRNNGWDGTIPNDTGLEYAPGEEAALEAEDAMAERYTVEVSGGDITINSELIGFLSEMSAAYTSDAEAELGSSVARHLRNTVRVLTDTNDVDISIDRSVMDTKADRVRVETPDYFVYVNLNEIAEDFGSGSSYKIKLSETESTDIRATSGLAYTGGMQPLAASKKALRLELTDGKTGNPLTLGIKPEGGDTTYQAIINLDTGSAVASKYNSVTNKMEGKVTENGTYAVKNNEKNFSDISGKSAEMQSAIKYLASKGIINGTTATTFSPDGSISRAEIAALILRAIGKNSVSVQNVFKDVSSSDWFYSTACSSYKLRIINGYEDNTFRGYSSINKVQIVAVSARVLKSEMNYKELCSAQVCRYLTKYSDGVDTWARGDVALATFANLVVPRADGCFAGSSSMTRGDAAVVIYRLFEKIW